MVMNDVMFDKIEFNVNDNDNKFDLFNKNIIQKICLKCHK